MAARDDRVFVVADDQLGQLMENDAAAPKVADDDALKRLSGLCEQLLLAQFEAGRLDDALAAKEGEIRRLSEEDIPQLLKECGLSEVRLADGTRVTVSPDLDCSITDERRREALAWLRANNLGGIIKTVVALQFGRGDEEVASQLARHLASMGYQPELKEDVHWQTLKATLKAEREAGRPVPVETFALRPYEKAKLTLPDSAPRPPKIRTRK
jgi:hypothetical protein